MTQNDINGNKQLLQLKIENEKSYYLYDIGGIN